MALRNIGLPLPNAGRGWTMDDVYRITDHSYNNSQGGMERVDSFDVLFFHPPPLDGFSTMYDTVNRDSLMELVLLAGKLFRVETVVSSLSMPSFTNMVFNPT